MGSLQIDGGGVRQGKCYWCKYCGVAFSDGRVLGGHVRSHMAAAGLSRRSKKLAIAALGERLEGDSSGRSRGEHGCYGLRKNHKKPWKFSGMGEEKRECSPRGKNRCGICERGFRTSRALFGHMRLHPRKESMLAGSDRGEMGYSNTRVSLEEIMKDYEKICQTKTKERSVGARSNENLPANDPSLSAFLAGGIHRDEFEAAICLLMFSRGVRHLELSDAVTGFWASSPPLVKTEDEVDDIEASDCFDLGVSNKRRRVGDIVNAAIELQEVSGRLGTFSTCSNSGGKLKEYGISFHMVSQEIEVQSPQRMDNVKDLARDSVEVYKVAEPTFSGQLSGGCKKKLPLGSDTGKYHVPLKKEGYKCKDCGKIFAIHQALGGHRAKFKNGSCQITEKNEKDAALCSTPADKVAQMVSVTEAALRQPDHKCPTCGEVFSSGQALGGHKRRHYSKSALPL